MAKGKCQLDSTMVESVQADELEENSPKKLKKDNLQIDNQNERQENATDVKGQHKKKKNKKKKKENSDTLVSETSAHPDLENKQNGLSNGEIDNSQVLEETSKESCDENKNNISNPNGQSENNAEMSEETNEGTNNSNSGQAPKRKRKRNKKNKSQSEMVVNNPLTTVLSDTQPFSNLKDKVSEGTLKAIGSLGFTKMTDIQARSIPPLLEGKDVRATAKTGSGKTLAFIIPVVERLLKLEFTAEMGTGAIIISPTRELSMQTFNVLKKVTKNNNLTSTIIMGGVDQLEEADLLSKGVNIVVATPGRLLHHLKDTRQLVYKNLACLVIDEADRILDVGFEEEMNQIIPLLPPNKQTMFFSATRDKKVNLLARLSLNNEPLEVEDGSVIENPTNDTLQQEYCICPTDKKFLVLHNFLTKNIKKKIMVFFTTCNAVKFYHGLLNLTGFSVMHIHGKQKQEKRTNTFYDFCKSPAAILLCTDVAARGWDIPAVDWIVQYDPPAEPKEYIHRVGRTARAGNEGKSLLMIREEEHGLITYLKNHKVEVKCEKMMWNTMPDLDLRVRKIVNNNKGLRVLATVALMSYLRHYMDSGHQDIFNFKTMDVNKLSKGLGFETPPPLSKTLQGEVDRLFIQSSNKKRKTKFKGPKSNAPRKVLTGANAISNTGEFKGLKFGKKSPFTGANAISTTGEFKGLKFDKKSPFKDDTKGKFGTRAPYKGKMFGYKFGEERVKKRKKKPAKNDDGKASKSEKQVVKLKSDKVFKAKDKKK